MKVLVTGGAGFIGSHIVDALLEEGHSVVVIDDLSSGSRANLAAGVELIEHDLASMETAALIAREAPGVVVHAAAQVSVAASMADARHDAASNILGSIGVFDGARAAGARQVIYITTGGALYGEPQYLPCDEDHPIEPISPYGLSKWAGERYLVLLLPGAVRTALRLANVYGPRQSATGEAGVVATFLSRMLSGAPVEIHGAGNQTRDFVFVGDVADAVCRAIRTPDTAAINIGSGTATSVLQLFEVIARLTDYRLPPTRADSRAGDIRNSVLDVGRAEAILGWRPQVTLDEGLGRTMDWYLASGSRRP